MRSPFAAAHWMRLRIVKYLPERGVIRRRLSRIRRASSLYGPLTERRRF